MSAATEFELALDLLPAHKYTILAEGIFSSSSVSCKLEWASQAQERELIPLTALYGEMEDISSAIHNVKPEVTFECFPNPFRSTFILSIEGTFGYQIFDMQGRLIEKGTGKDKCELGGTLDQGTYLLKVSQGQNQVSGKLIKQ